MPMQKAQLQRLIRIAALLKENRYPNSKSLVEEFRQMEEEEGVNVNCVKKTILRDMKTLENDFHCPLAFDRKRNGYYLTHHGWDFIAPALLDENEMLAAVIGARIAEAIFPQPLKGKIRRAVDYLLENNNPDFLDTANMDSLSILSGLYAELDNKIFMTVFTGWQEHRCVRIEYADYAGEVTERVFEPHTLVFSCNSWYSKGICHLKHAPRTFAVRRMRSAELTDAFFQPDKNIINSVTVDNFLGYAKIKNVRLRVHGPLAEQLAAHPLHTQQVIHEDGTVDVPAVTKEALFPFILSAQGDVELLAPAELRAELKQTIAKMLSAYQKNS